MSLGNYTLNHLDEREAESIYILREVAAQFAKPVILYSVGKDSSVLVRLAQKAFTPGKIPFPVMHVDTGFKFGSSPEFVDTFPKLEPSDLEWRCRKIPANVEERLLRELVLGLHERLWPGRLRTRFAPAPRRSKLEA